MAELRRLTCIRVASQPGKYIATLTTDDGHDQDYEFTVYHSKTMTGIQESDEFGEDVGPFGYSHLVHKAILAFHDSHEKLVGRPDGYEARPSQSRPEGTDNS